jgi:hypothetical protein
MHVTSSAVVLDPARVIVPYTKKLTPQVLWALQVDGVEFETVDVSGSDEAYFDLFCECWRDGKSFTFVEHDIVAHSGVVPGFDRCDRDWCAASYPYLRGTYWGLGCVRFSSRLIERLPEVPDELADWESPNHPPKHWCTLDQSVTTTLRYHGEQWPHLHGEVQHLGTNLPAHGCRV